MKENYLSADKFLSEPVIKLMAKSSPSDYVTIENREAAHKLTQCIWKAEASHIPADLVFADTVPIKDMVITVACGNDMYCADAAARNEEAQYRFVIFEREDWISLVGPDGTYHVCGARTLSRKIHGSEPKKEITSLLIVKDGSVGFQCSKHRIIHDPKLEKLVRKHMDELYSDEIVLLGIWYGIQVAMLHPLTRTILSEPRIEKLHGKTVYPRDESGRRVKYVKYHHLTPDCLEFDLRKFGMSDEEARKYTRKTLVWHVAGHWHTFDTLEGKKTKFVQGYWKGPLRDIQSNLDDQRRIIQGL